MNRRFVLALCFAVAACGNQAESREDLLVGEWSCLVTLPDQVNRIEMDYAPDGRRSALLDREFTRAGSRGTLSARTTGTWAIEGDELIETIDDAIILSAIENGVPIENPAMIDYLQSSLAGHRSKAQIINLDENSMRLGTTTATAECTRT